MTPLLQHCRGKVYCEVEIHSLTLQGYLERGLAFPTTLHRIISLRVHPPLITGSYITGLPGGCSKINAQTSVKQRERVIRRALAGESKKMGRLAYACVAGTQQQSGTDRSARRKHPSMNSMK